MCSLQIATIRRIFLVGDYGVVDWRREPALSLF